MKAIFRFCSFVLLVGIARSATGETSSDAPATPLDALVAAIAGKHPELRFYEAELAVAQAARKTAGARSDAEVSVEAGRKRVHDSAGELAGEGAVWSVSLSQTFEWPGRLALRKAIANRDVALAELGVERFHNALSGRVRLLAWELAAAREKAAAVAEVAERFRVLKETHLARDPAGVTPLLETRVIEAQELVLQRRATEAGLAAQQSLAELNQLRGASLDTPLVLKLPKLVIAGTPSVGALVAAAREHSFEFKARRLELEQQGYALRLARHERRPSFTLSPFFSQEEAGERERTAGLSLTMPLPGGGRTRSNVELAAARERQAEAALGMAERELERDVVRAAQALSAKQAEVERWLPESAGKFREAAALADRHYRLGAVPLSTYVELQIAYLDAVEALLDTQHEALEAGLALQQLVGRASNFVQLLP